MINYQLSALVVGATLLTISSVQASSIAVDFSTGRNNGNVVSSTVSDFQANDANFENSGTISQLVEDDAAAWSVYSTATQIADGIFVQTEGAARSYSPGAASWNEDIAILDSYIYGLTDDGSESLIISGLSQFTSGETMTLTVYGMGDNVGQDAVYTIAYSAIVDTSLATDFGTNQGTETDSTRFDQIVFSADGSDTITIDTASYFNGFSLSVVPEPSAYGMLVGLFVLGASIVRRRP